MRQPFGAKGERVRRDHERPLVNANARRSENGLSRRGGGGWSRDRAGLVAAWQAAYPGLMPAGYLAGLDAEAALPGFERGLRANPSVLVLELDGEILGFSRYGASRDPDLGQRRGR